MKKRNIITAATAIALMSSAALGGIVTGIEQDSGTKVYVEGQVDMIENSRQFEVYDLILQRKVEVESETPLNLEVGQIVAIEGILDRGVFDTEIDAHHVEVMN